MKRYIIYYVIGKQHLLSVLVGDKAVKKQLSRSDGPFVKNLNHVLLSFHVERQAYYCSREPRP